MMSLFTPPTDNLYKFLALTGLVFIAVGLAIPAVFFRQTGMEYLAQLRGSQELEVQEEFTNQRLETLKHREQEAIGRRTILQKRLDGLNSTSNSAEVDKLEGLVKEANREIESIADSSKELSLNLALKRAQVNSEETVSVNQRRDSRVLLGIGAIAFLLGLLLSVLGFVLWYRRLQRFQDRETAEKAGARLGFTAMNKQNSPVQTDNQTTQDNVSEPTK